MRITASLVALVVGALGYLALVAASKTHPTCSRYRGFLGVLTGLYAATPALIVWFSVGLIDPNGGWASVVVAVLVGMSIGFSLVVVGLDSAVAFVLAPAGLKYESGQGRIQLATKALVAAIDQNCGAAGHVRAWEVFPVRIRRRYSLRSFHDLMIRNCGNDEAAIADLNDAYKNARALTEANTGESSGLSNGQRRREAYRTLVHAAYYCPNAALRPVLEQAARPILIPRVIKR